MFKVAQGKTYKIRAESAEQKDTWVKVINERLEEMKQEANIDPSKAEPLQIVIALFWF